MKIFSLVLAIIFCSTTAFSQTSIYGKITDGGTGEELIYAHVVLNKKGVFATGASTDFEGNYDISIDPGIYEMRISYTGYPDRIITDVVKIADQRKHLDIQLNQVIFYVNDTYKGYKIPLIEQDDTISGQTITSEQIRNKATKNIQELTLSAPGVSLNNF